MKTPLIGCSVLLLAYLPSVAGADDEQLLDFFESKIRPVLIEHCYECHSAEAATKSSLKGALLLDSRDGSRKGGESGPAVVPGKPEESLLISALKQEAFEMPPKGKLPAEVIADFVTWIEAGATDPRDGTAAVAASATIDIEAGKQHWAFQPLAAVTPPETESTWGATAVDQFIHAKHLAAGVEPNDVAGPRTLIRRAYFDLIGLPPAPERVEAFVRESADDPGGTYDRLIDELLANEHYGERWARHWLDITRFAESNGYAFDGDRPNAWHYRDFVIRALNSDLPYDEFVRLQLTGDLLADLNVQTTEQAQQTIGAIAATGFLVAGPYTTQQTQKERERSRYEQLDDIVNTLGTSLLGMTVGCSRCHDHKFDPLPQQDYYRLASCFAEVGFADTAVNSNPEAFEKAKAEHEAARALLIADQTKYEQESLPAKFEQWVADTSAGTFDFSALPALSAWHHVGPFSAGSYDEAFDRVFPPETDQDLARTFEDGKLKWTEHPDWMDGVAQNDKLSGDNSANYLLRTIDCESPRVLTLSLGADDGIKVWVNGLIVIAKKIGMGAAAPDQDTVTIQLPQGRNELLMKVVNGGGPSGYYFAATGGAAPDDVKAVLAVAAEERSAEQTQTLLAWYKKFDREWLRLNEPVAQHDKLAPVPEQAQIFASKVRGTTYQFGDDTYKVFHLRRGNADNKEAEASPGFLQVLMRSEQQEQQWLAASAEAEASRKGRVGLSRWLTDVDEGAGQLLARVIVNRLWHYHFGRGIVATPSDFGTRGDRPSHPELLDWLAAELIRGGWQLKPIHKLIMTSTVYMQGDAVTETGQRYDPENLLLWRRQSRRLDAESIRDSLLAVSGTLDASLYGKGTLDQNSRRRSIYFTIKRSQLIPMLTLFNAPDAMQGIARREQSTVAPQALALLNSPIIRDLATRFAEEVRPTPETTVAAAIDRAYQMALARPANDMELAAMTEFIQEQTAVREGDANAESLAVRDFCHLVLCMNEFIYID